MNVYMKWIGVATILLIVNSLSAVAQESIPGRPVICYGSSTTTNIHHKLSAQQGRLRAATATILVTYSGFPEAAKVPFQRAVDSWAALLDSPVPIHIDAKWASLPGNALAATTATKLYRGFAQAAQPNSWYPVALAEKLTGHELNGAGQADMSIILNANGNWYLGLDGQTPADQLDFLTVVLHEIAHGVGFSSSATATDPTGTLRDDGYLDIYDAILENKAGVRTATFADPSASLFAQLTSNDLYLHSPTAASQSGYPKVFAPSYFIVGSSMSHLDESTYPPGDANALMTPYFARGESVHSFGTLLPAILADLGWQQAPAITAGLLVYPNPGTDLVTVQVSAVSLRYLRVTNLAGQVVMNVPELVSQGGLAQLNVSGLAGGVYLITIGTTTGEERRKLVVLR